MSQPRESRWRLIRRQGIAGSIKAGNAGQASSSLTINVERMRLHHWSQNGPRPLLSQARSPSVPSILRE